MLNRIFLVRHAQSVGNVDHVMHRIMADQDVPLSETGAVQARAAAKALNSWYLSYFGPLVQHNTKIWSSPALRAQQSAKPLREATCTRRGWVQNKQELVEGPLARSYVESLYLAEHQFGLFDGLTDEQRAEQYPREWAYYQKVVQGQNGRLYAKMPMGESAFDVILRTHLLEEIWDRDCQNHDIQDIIVVSHGITLKALTMNLLGKTPEWFEEETRPNNASVRMLNRPYHQKSWVDQGYIFKGYHKDGRPA